MNLFMQLLKNIMRSSIFPKFDNTLWWLHLVLLNILNKQSFLEVHNMKVIQKKKSAYKNLHVYKPIKKITIGTLNTFPKIMSRLQKISKFNECYCADSAACLICKIIPFKT